MADEQQKTNSVVLVDDDRFLLDAYSMKLVHSGFDVHSFLSVDEALAALRAGLHPNAILFDILMPGKDGFALLQALKDEKLAQDAVWIALTNQSEGPERKTCESLGVCRYVIKASVIPSEVVAIVNEELGKQKRHAASA